MKLKKLQNSINKKKFTDLLSLNCRKFKNYKYVIREKMFTKKIYRVESI